MYDNLAKNIQHTTYYVHSYVQYKLVSYRNLQENVPLDFSAHFVLHLLIILATCIRACEYNYGGKKEIYCVYKI